VTEENELLISRIWKIDWRNPIMANHPEKQSKFSTTVRVNGELAVSRSFGDVDYKKPRVDNYPWSFPEQHAVHQQAASQSQHEMEMSMAMMSEDENDNAHHSHFGVGVFDEDDMEEEDIIPAGAAATGGGGGALHQLSAAFSSSSSSSLLSSSSSPSSAFRSRSHANSPKQALTYEFKHDLVLCEPEWISMDLSEEDDFVIIACDGLWDVSSLVCCFHFISLSSSASSSSSSFLWTTR
jgi:serine/threonine protein phosphatase PrpC